MSRSEEGAPPALPGAGVERGAALGQYLFPAPPRVVGPGRLERRYREEISGLEQALARETERTGGLARELASSQLVERGSQRLLDRLEGLVQDERGAREALEQREKRLILCLGGLQRENELLRERLALAGPEARRGITEGAPAADAGRSPRGAAPRPGVRAARTPRPGWLARLFRR